MLAFHKNLYIMTYEEKRDKENVPKHGATIADLKKFGVDTSGFEGGPFCEKKNELVTSIDKFIRYQPSASS